MNHTVFCSRSCFCKWWSQGQLWRNVLIFSNLVTGELESFSTIHVHPVRILSNLIFILKWWTEWKGDNREKGRVSEIHSLEKTENTTEINSKNCSHTTRLTGVSTIVVWWFQVLHVAWKNLPVMEERGYTRNIHPNICVQWRYHQMCTL